MCHASKPKQCLVRAINDATCGGISGLVVVNLLARADIKGVEMQGCREAPYAALLKLL